MFFKTKKSNICVAVTQNINANNQDLQQISYFTESYVMSQVLDKTTLYIAKDNAQYMVDKTNQILKHIDFSQHTMQINQLKVAVGKIAITENNTSNGRKLSLKNDSSQGISLEGGITIENNSLLEKTCQAKYQAFSNTLQLFTIDLTNSEFVTQSTVKIIANGQEQISNVQLVEIKLL